MITQIDVDNDYSTKLSNIIFSNDFAWYICEKTTLEYKVGAVFDCKTKDVSQFTHTLFFDNEVMSKHYHFFSKMVDIVEPIIGKIKRILRIKVNMLVKDSSYPSGFYNGAHADYYGDNIVSFVYYVNDSDGDTVIFDKYLDGSEHNINELTVVHRQSPKAGTGVAFKSNRLHSSSTPTINSNRVVINYVFEMENNVNILL